MLAIGLVSVAVAGGYAAERTVVVPQDNKPFSVEEGDVIRLTGDGIAGAKITAKVEGPGKVTAENRVAKRENGRLPIGPATTEFEVKPTGKGKIVVKITVENPTGDNPKPVVYEITVE